MSIHQIAQYVVLYCNLKGIEISHLKLQKLLYYIQSWHLVYYDNSLIFEDVPEAWLNGPVYTSIYSDYFHTKRFKMNDFITVDKDQIEMEKEFTYLNEMLSDKAELVNTVLLRYSTLSAEKLVLLTHCELPWNNAREKCKDLSCKEKISLNDMYSYYTSLIKVKE